MKKILFFTVCAALSVVSAGNILEINFNTPGDWRAENQDIMLKPLARGTADRPSAPGVKGSAVWFAAGNQQDFPGGTSGKVIGTLRYHGIKNFPQNSGAIRLYTAPYFNGIPRKNSKNHNYIFRFFNTGGPGKIITAFFYDNRRIDLQFAMDNGKYAFLSADIPAEKKQKFLQLDIIWQPGVQQLYVDGKLACEKHAAGKILPVNAVEIGGVDNFGPFMMQGVLDELTVSPDLPDDLVIVKKQPQTISRDVDGDPDKFPVIAAGNFMLNGSWQGEKGTSAKVENGKLILSWAGKDFRKKRIFGPEIKVNPGTFIKGTLHFAKRRFDDGSFAPAEVVFFDRQGKEIFSRRFDTSNISGYRPMRLNEFQETVGNRVTIAYFNYFRVPENAATVRPAWSFARNPVVIEVSRLEFRYVDPAKKPWFSQPDGKGNLQLTCRQTAPGDVDAILAKRTRPTVKLARCGDRVEILVDGKPVPPLFMHNCLYNIKNRTAYTAEFSRMGAKFITVPLALGRGLYPHHPAALAPDGKLDLSGWQQRLREHIVQHPDGYLMLAIIIFPPDKWLRENEDQLMKDHNGVNFIYGYPHYPLGKGAAKELPKGNFSRYPSQFSEKYTRYICAELERVLTEFEKLPEAKAVAGIYLLGGDDDQFRMPSINTTPDCSPVALEGFRKFLRRKYRTDENLRAAWGDKNAAFDKVTIPAAKTEIWPRDRQYYAMGGKDSWLSDYVASYSLAERRFKSAIRNTAKKAIPRLIVGNYDCAYGLSGSWGHTGYHQHEAYQDNGDFSLYIPSYGRDRECGDLSLGIYQFTGSAQLHGKLPLMELDVRNLEISGLTWMPYKSRNFQQLHNADTFRIGLRRLAVQSLVMGGGFHYFNLYQQWCRTPKALESLKDMFRIAAYARPSQLDRNRIAVFIDEHSDMYANTHPGWIPGFFNFKNVPCSAVQRSGVPFNYFLASDALHPDFTAPGVLFFADAATLKPETVAEIRRRYGKDDRVIVWHGSPSFLVETDLKKISAAIGFNLKYMPAYDNALPADFDDNYELISPDEPRKSPLYTLDSNDPLLKDVHGFFMQESIVVPHVYSPHWAVADQEAVPLAKFFGTGAVGMAVKRYKNHTEVFIGQPGAITPTLFRNFALEAG
ncbi:MAG: hypothetical protein E7058_07240, partial [Lentisphaerae bacterium]|nr:hypothetical protein [Lentisphaerota bacterium]